MLLHGLAATARAEKLAATRPDDEADTGLAALASGQRPVAGDN